MPRGKCVEKGAFVAKFGYLWRNSAFFVAKKAEISKFFGQISLFLGSQKRQITKRKLYFTMTKNRFTFHKCVILTIFSLMATLVQAQVFSFNGNGGDALWSNPNNWEDGLMPTLGNANVYLGADVVVDKNFSIQFLSYYDSYNITIQEGKRFVVNGTIEWYKGGDIILEDAAQLVYDEDLPLKVMKHIKAYDAATHMWNLISSPIMNEVTPSLENGFLTEPETGYALYAYDAPSQEWVSFKDSPFMLFNGYSYLYANALDTTLLFEGKAMGSAVPAGIDLSYYPENGSLAGCNFVGNPMPCNAFADRSYYVVNEESNSLIAIPQSSNTIIPPCKGIIVDATFNYEMMFFQRQQPGQQSTNGYLEITAAKSSAPNLVLDQALLSFNPGDDLNKYALFEHSPQVYFTKDNKDLAILSIDSMGVQPFKFKALENDSYTFHFELQDLNPEYLHLIDNMTGANIDLLTTPQYTFNAKTTDYASRFKLIFDPHYGVGEYGNDVFAYYANGEIVINDVETCHALQIIDMTGRVIMKRDAMNRVSTSGLAKGVYVLRLNTTDGVRTQKMVIQ